MSGVHHALDVEYPPDREDDVLTLLWSLGTSGIQELAPGRQRAFFPAAATAAARRLAGVPGVSIVVRRIADQDWILASRRHLRSQRIGPLLVRTPWSRSGLRAGESLLVIDPARAFGTGGHESTRLALRALTALPLLRQRVLDVGCGSGILALAALRLGASSAIALDIDAEATSATIANARRNGLKPQVVQGGIDTIAATFDVVLANLTFPLLVAQAEALQWHVAATGSLVCAGLLTRDRDALVERLMAVGFNSFKDGSEGEWQVVVARRSASQL